jgi:tetratricopeptide (TPR) repeat protein
MGQMSAADIQKVYAEGLAFQGAGNLDAALKTFGSIVTDNPKIAEAHFQIGRILTGAHRYEAAFPYLKEAVRLRPAEVAVWQAWSDAVALGGTALDEAEITRVVKSAPVDPKFRILLQDRYGARRSSTRPPTGGMSPKEIRPLMMMLAAGQLSQAENAAQKLLKRYPGSAIGWNILGTAQARQNKTSVATQNLQKAISIAPGYAEAHDNLGQVYMDQGRYDDAISQFQRAVCLAPGLPSALVRLASLLNRAGESHAALLLLDRALASGAEAQPCYLALGNTHTKLKNYAKAEAAFLKALEKTPKSAAGRQQSHEGLGLLAQAQARLGKDAEAMANFQRALEMNKDSAVATVGMASLLQTLGRFDEAEPMFRRGFELDPTNGENFRNFIASHKTKPGDPIIEQMVAVYETPALSPNDRIGLGFAIAKALEDTKEYDRVFRYLSDANALMRQAHPYDIATRYHEIAQTKSVFSGFDWQGTKIKGTSDFAPIFVTGMPRSGTTLIEQIISSHSAISGAGEVGAGTRAAHDLLQKANHRPMADLPTADIAALGHDYESYLRALFSDTPQVTDKSIQTYMYLGLMKLALPNARFIVVRRDPRDTLLSIFKNKFPDDTHNYAYDQRDLALYYKTFVEMIDFWRDLVPDWFYEVEYEALVANPEDESRKLIAACGLEWEDACLNFHQNTRKVETLSLYQVRQPISGGSVKGWKRYEAELAPMLTTLRENGLVTD